MSTINSRQISESRRLPFDQNDVTFKLLKMSNYPWISRTNTQTFIQSPNLRRKTYFRDMVKANLLLYFVGRYVFIRKQLPLIAISSIAFIGYAFWQDWRLKNEGKYQQLFIYSPPESTADNKYKSMIINVSKEQQKPRFKESSQIKLPKNIKLNNIDQLVQSLPKEYFLS